MKSGILATKVNALSQPRLTKVLISVRTGRFKDDAAQLATAKEELARITGQRPSLRRAKKAIAAFKIKEGDLVGFLVTLRGSRRRDFVEKLTRVVLPAVRDFRGLSSKNLDRQGNLNIGLKEQAVFPEIDPNKIDRSRGLGISLVAANLNRGDQARGFWRSLGFVFSNERGLLE